MWAVVVEVDAPCRHQIAGMAQSVEEVLVQAFVPHPAIKGLHKAILHWFARRDVMPVNLPVLLPLQDRIRSQFGSVVADHHAGIASHLGDPIQLTGYADAGQGRINDGSQTFSAEVVDHIQDTEPAATGQAVRHEVERPPLVRSLRDRHGRLGAQCTLASAPFTNG